MKKVALSPEILEDCLSRIDQGEALESVLAEYANISDELRPLLEAARFMSKPVYVPQAARARSQARFLAAARQTRLAEAKRARSRLAHELRQPVLLWSWLPVRVVAALSLVLGLLTSGFYGVNHVAAQSNPGDRFYPVKRAVEQVQIQFAPNVAARLKLETEFDQLRTVEIEHLIQDARSEPVVFTGFAAQGVSGRWEVNGIPVDVTPEQEKQLAASQKVLVQVQGQIQPDGSVLVENAEPHNINFQGKVEVLNTVAWQVDGVKFGVSKNTRISGNPQVGSSVAVVALEDDDDSLEAVTVDAQGQTGESVQKTPILLTTPTTQTTPAKNNEAPKNSEEGDD
jgi:hypothetical protein